MLFLKNANQNGSMKIFNKILVANRGEIAVRIIRTLRSMGINSVAVYSEKDRNALHCRIADEAYMLSGDSLRDTYLNIDKIIEIARESDSEAIHPGYGFLSENPEFSDKVAKAGINFIGPDAGVIKKMGNKLEARSVARNAGVPLIEGFEGSVKDILENRNILEYPLIIKAAAGGGGKAMRIVRTEKELAEALEVTAREAYNYFADGGLYVEKYFEKGRHIEVQVLADHYGNVIIPGERECSIQRRYQKVIEETPSAFISEKTRQNLFNVSRKIVKEITYINAGTIEFLVDQEQNIYFLEMNTRIQVEHPITEETSGLDIVAQQIYIAAGNELKLKQEDIKPVGHAIQARVYAEDPGKNFLPSPGNIYHYSEPEFPGLRIDSGIDSPSMIYPDYDPLISKVIAKAASREEAILLLKKSLMNYKIAGVRNNREFLLSLISDPDFIRHEVSTTWLENKKDIIIGKLVESKKEIQNSSVFAAWLIKVLFTNASAGTNPWQRVGYWRHHIKKSFLYEARQYDIQVMEKKKSRLIFKLEEQEFDVQLRSMNEEKILFTVNGNWCCATVTTGMDIEDIVIIRGFEFRLKPMDYLPDMPFVRDDSDSNPSGPRIIKSPLHGRVVKMNAILNQRVNKGELLFILDAMKIENKIMSPYEGFIKEIRINEGDQVSIDQEILIIDNSSEK